MVVLELLLLPLLLPHVVLLLGSVSRVLVVMLLRGVVRVVDRLDEKRDVRRLKEAWFCCCCCCCSARLACLSCTNQPFCASLRGTRGGSSIPSSLEAESDSGTLPRFMSPPRPGGLRPRPCAGSVVGLQAMLFTLVRRFGPRAPAPASRAPDDRWKLLSRPVSCRVGGPTANGSRKREDGVAVPPPPLVWMLWNAVREERGELASGARLLLLMRSEVPDDEVVVVLPPAYKSDLVDRSTSFLRGYQTWT